MTHESRPKAAIAVDAADPTPFTEASGRLAAAWTIEARLHLLAAGRLLELDPERRHQARHIFGLAARVAA